MTRIDIVSGFLGAGKTTLIKKLLAEAFQGEKIVLIENEYGEIGVDSGFLKETGVQITEMNSGCICCTLVGDFDKALKQVVTDYAPDRVIIEPSGVGKLSDIAKAIVHASQTVPMELGSAVAVVNGPRCKVLLRNFGEFFLDQVEHAGTILISRTQSMTDEKVQEAVDLLRQHNTGAPIITTPWDELPSEKILEAMAGNSLAEELLAELAKGVDDSEVEHHHHHHHHHGEEEHEHEHEECECHHHHHDEGEECECHHHHHDEGEECECHHHHHDEDEEHEHHHHHDGEACECGHHHHHDEDEEECECGCGHHHDHEHHHHHHHGEHDADEVFTSWGLESPKRYTVEKLEHILEELDDCNKYGQVLRAKGIVPSEDGKWLHFDYTPSESSVREGTPDYTGRLCVIGAEINEKALGELFNA